MTNPDDPLARLEKVLSSPPPHAVDELNRAGSALRTSLWTVLIALVMAGAVVVVAGTAAYLGADYAVRQAAQGDEDIRRDQAEARARRDAQIAQTQAVLEEYRRQQCAITNALPKPLTAEIVNLRRLLRCDANPPTPVGPPSPGQSPLPVPSVRPS